MMAVQHGHLGKWEEILEVSPFRVHATNLGHSTGNGMYCSFLGASSGQYIRWPVVGVTSQNGCTGLTWLGSADPETSFWSKEGSTGGEMFAYLCANSWADSIPSITFGPLCTARCATLPTPPNKTKLKTENRLFWQAAEFFICTDFSSSWICKMGGCFDSRKIWGQTQFVILSKNMRAPSPPQSKWGRVHSHFKYLLLSLCYKRYWGGVSPSDN